MISFNIPPFTGRELEYVKQAIDAHKICGDGPFTRQCSAWLEQNFAAEKVNNDAPGPSHNSIPSSETYPGLGCKPEFMFLIHKSRAYAKIFSVFRRHIHEYIKGSRQAHFRCMIAVARTHGIVLVKSAFHCQSSKDVISTLSSSIIT